MKKKEHGFVMLGMMSGTSLDGLDLALCRFHQAGKKWRYHIEKAHTMPYKKSLQKVLSEVHLLGGEELVALHVRMSNCMSDAVHAFLKDCKEKPMAISSHGHTVFHQPEKGFTFQAGSGAVLAANTGIPVVCDFRSTDVALGGQGAPLVPMGDRLLFSDYDVCVNLGGIVNLSYALPGGKRMAFDVCAGNQLLNLLASREGKTFDKNGKSARKGEIIADLIKKLNAHPFYNKREAKSLGREWLEKNVFPLVLTNAHSSADLLCTSCHHIGMQIAKAIPPHAKKAKVLLTGGGALNSFLVETIQQHCGIAKVVVPDMETICFKEALIFAFLGLLRMRGEENIDCTYTGAMRNTVSGAVYLP
ncbi:MAG: anhydro-N-acetylmuramic acid kinase [Bacteroidota bacterium]|jgi:anhydro-N-acetylmuramic acid kinase